jgi:hypothetical protein
MKPKIALFIQHPMCSVQSSNGIIAALEDHYTFKIFSKHKVERNFFKDVDIIAIPGGFGDSNSYFSLMSENKRAIKHFMSKGGRYLGICMGAYWAGSNYLRLLEDRDCVQYITRPNADTLRPHAKAMDVVWNNRPQRMFFYDGCSIVGDGEFDTVAIYANGDTMAGYQGRIGLIGCHPESEKSWYRPYPYMSDCWHKGKHHTLLKDFVDDLMRR